MYGSAVAWWELTCRYIGLVAKCMKRGAFVILGSAGVTFAVGGVVRCMVAELKDSVAATTSLMLLSTPEHFVLEA